MFSLADGHEAEACEDRFMVIRRQEVRKRRYNDEVRITTRKQLKDMCFGNKHLGIINNTILDLTTLYVLT